MSALSLKTADGRTAFRPGEEVTGTASWRLANAPEAVEVRLFWYTEGKGTRDVEVVACARWEDAREADEREFRLALPDGPFSFSGKLVSLLWALELVVEPSGQVERLVLTVSPTGREVVLYPDEGAG